jgi:hypothetical protein
LFLPLPSFVNLLVCFHLFFMCPSSLIWCLLISFLFLIFIIHFFLFVCFLISLFISLFCSLTFLLYCSCFFGPLLKFLVSFFSLSCVRLFLLSNLLCSFISLLFFISLYCDICSFLSCCWFIYFPLLLFIFSALFCICFSFYCRSVLLFWLSWFLLSFFCFVVPDREMLIPGENKSDAKWFAHSRMLTLCSVFQILWKTLWFLVCLFLPGQCPNNVTDCGEASSCTIIMPNHIDFCPIA